MPKRTDFGAGYWAKVLYFIGGAVPTGIVMAASKAPWDVFSSAPLEIGTIVVGGGIVFPALCGLSARALSQSHKRGEQTKRDKRAAEIMRECTAGSAQDFSLYLRAFETTARMPYEAGFSVSAVDLRQADDAETDLETGLAEAVEGDIPLVALGKPGEHHGAGRILTSDDRWQSDLALLADKATILFMVPSVRPGTLWEVDRIISDRLLHKTIWFQPPTRTGWLRKLTRRQNEFDWVAAWGPIAAQLRSRDIDFPDYDRQGCIFTIGNDGRLKCVTNLKGYTGGTDLPRFINKHLSAIAN